MQTFREWLKVKKPEDKPKTRMTKEVKKNDDAEAALREMRYLNMTNKEQLEQGLADIGESLSRLEEEQNQVQKALQNRLAELKQISEQTNERQTNYFQEKLEQVSMLIQQIENEQKQLQRTKNETIEDLKQKQTDAFAHLDAELDQVRESQLEMLSEAKIAQEKALFSLKEEQGKVFVWLQQEQEKAFTVMKTEQESSYQQVCEKNEQLQQHIEAKQLEIHQELRDSQQQMQENIGLHLVEVKEELKQERDNFFEESNRKFTDLIDAFQKQQELMQADKLEEQIQALTNSVDEFQKQQSTYLETFKGEQEQVRKEFETTLMNYVKELHDEDQESRNKEFGIIRSYFRAVLWILLIIFMFAAISIFGVFS